MSRTDGSKVLGQYSDGTIRPITIADLSTQAPKGTTTVTFSGNLSSTAASQTVGSVKVIDSLGGEHTLTVNLTNDSANTAGGWTVQVLEGTTVVGTGAIAFSNGSPVAGSSTVSLTYTPSGLAAMPLTLDFSKNVTSFASGNLSTLAFASQDGYVAGMLTGETFDATGTLVLSYSNGQTVKGPQLSLGRFDSVGAVAAVGNNEFDATNPLAWHTGIAGAAGFGAVRAGMVELSNVDLSKEFSNLVIMQRGYQASSQVISTANDMLQELLTMKGK